jgi:hypothetical protein
MTPPGWSDRLDAAGESLLRKEGPVRVLVALTIREADEACLEALRRLGLDVEEIVGNKVIGTIEGQRLDGLKSAPEVAEVELPSRLRPHGG